MEQVSSTLLCWNLEFQTLRMGLTCNLLFFQLMVISWFSFCVGRGSCSRPSNRREEEAQPRLMGQPAGRAGAGGEWTNFLTKRAFVFGSAHRSPVTRPSVNRGIAMFGLTPCSSVKKSGSYFSFWSVETRDVSEGGDPEGPEVARSDARARETDEDV